MLQARRLALLGRQRNEVLQPARFEARGDRRIVRSPQPRDALPIPNLILVPLVLLCWGRHRLAWLGIPSGRIRRKAVEDAHLVAFGPKAQRHLKVVMAGEVPRSTRVRLVKATDAEQRVAPVKERTIVKATSSI